MPGESDLPTLLNSLSPRLAEDVYAFCLLRPGQAMPDGVRAIGSFEEAEGLTVIAPAEQLADSDIEHSPGWAMITLEVHSSLEAVGMMAFIATALAKAGISVNPVSAYHHDHIFVQWDRRHDAMAILAAQGSAG